MKKIYWLSILILASIDCGCVGLDSVRVGKKEVTFIHIGFGLCATYLDVDDITVDVDPESEAEPALGGGSMGS